jgi:hypothetical protein
VSRGLVPREPAIRRGPSTYVPVANQHVGRPDVSVPGVPGTCRSGRPSKDRTASLERRAHPGRGLHNYPVRVGVRVFADGSPRARGDSSATSRADCQRYAEGADLHSWRSCPSRQTKQPADVSLSEAPVLTRVQHLPSATQRGRADGVIDDEQIDRPLARLQSQTELPLHGAEHGGAKHVARLAES